MMTELFTVLGQSLWQLQATVNSWCCCSSSVVSADYLGVSVHTALSVLSPQLSTLLIVEGSSLNCLPHQLLRVVRKLCYLVSHTQSYIIIQQNVCVDQWEVLFIL